MLSEVYYLVRSKTDGKYLTAHPQGGDEAAVGYLLLFQEHYEALSYLNTHGAEVANRFAVESVAQTQLKGVLQRWGFRGVALVQDPLPPQIQFMSYG